MIEERTNVSIELKLKKRNVLKWTTFKVDDLIEHIHQADTELVHFGLTHSAGDFHGLTPASLELDWRGLYHDMLLTERICTMTNI